MWNLEDVGADRLSEVSASGQLALAVCLQIAREEHGSSGETGPQDERGVVDREAGWRFDAAVGQRTEWLDGDLAELGRGDDRRRDVSGFGERDESAVLRVSPVVAARPKGTHVEPLQHSNRPFR